jgi:hypothetical protein
MKAYAKRISHFDETTLLVLFKRLARWGCKPKPQKIPRPLDHAYSPSPDDPSVPRVGWRPITVLTASQSFDRSNANQGTHLSDVIRGNLFPTRCYLLMSN